MYAFWWKLFHVWPIPHWLDPVHCLISNIKTSLQGLVDSSRGLVFGKFPNTLMVLLGAIAAHHSIMNGMSLGFQKLIKNFMKVVTCFHPSEIHKKNLLRYLVLESLKTLRYESIHDSKPKKVYLQTAILLTSTSEKRVGELHALAISSPSMC